MVKRKILVPIGIFFQNFDYCHFCSQSHAVSYDYTRFQNFKRQGSLRTQNTRLFGILRQILSPMNENIDIN